MRIVSCTKNISVSTPELKRNILQAMAKSEGRARDFVGYFSDSDFVLIPTNEQNGMRVWTAQKGDVTVMVWERGANYSNWVAKIQCW